MTKWRIIEMPSGKWRVERKGLIFYNPVWLLYAGAKCIEWCRSHPMRCMPDDAVHSFDSLLEAKNAIISSEVNMKHLIVERFETT